MNISYVTLIFTFTVVLKSESTRHLSPFQLRVPTNTFERLTLSLVDAIELCLVRSKISRFDKESSMKQMVEETRPFDIHRIAKYCTVVSFRRNARLTGTLKAAKWFYSEKYEMYSFITKSSVIPKRYCIRLSKHEPGSIPETSILRNNITLNSQALKKNCNEVHLLNNEPIQSAFPDSCALVVDEVYQRLADALRGIHLQKKPRKRRSCSQERHVNDMMGQIW